MRADANETPAGAQLAAGVVTRPQTWHNAIPSQYGFFFHRPLCAFGESDPSKPKVMATWQFDLHCLPRRAVEARCGARPIAISRDDFNSVDWWSGIPAPAAAIEGLSGVLPPASSWSKDIRKWGQEDGNRIDLSYQDGSLHGIFVRIDVREISHRFLIDVVDLATQQDWVLRLHDTRILDPSVVGLMTAIQRSSSFQFVLDPLKFLEQLEKRRKDDRKASAGLDRPRGKE